MDGYAVRAEDTFGAGDRSPVVLRSTDDTVGPGTARQVHTGSELPEGANAVVMTERVTEVGDELEIFDTVGEGENVAPVGEDVSAGQKLYEPGERLFPSDLGLLKSIGMTEIPVFEKPEGHVIPTGEELVESDPEPGEIIETNGLTVSGLVERWGGDPTYCDVVTDDKDRLSAAIEDGLSADVVVTTGGSSVGARDLLPVSCLVNAVQFLRPTLSWLTGTEPEPFPTVTARLDEKIHSEPGIRSFARVQLQESGDTSDDDGEYVARAVRASGAGVLSSVALSDGWVVVPENSEGIEQGDRVAVERWEWSP
jgi:molybdopterin molybdotransferase